MNYNEWLITARELYNLQQTRRKIELQEKELTNHLKTLSNNDAFSFGGIRYFFEERLGSVDYSAIPELQSVNVDLYRKPPVKVWKLAIESI